MIEGLFGLKEVSRNSQNQIILPAEFREIFEEHSRAGRFYVYMEEERCLLLSTLEELMNDIRNAQQSVLQTFDKNAFTVISKNMTIVNMGGDGRVTLSKDMMKKAAIKKEDKKVICCGVNNKVEIWSEERYRQQIRDREIEYTSQKKIFEKEVFKFNLSHFTQHDKAGNPDDPDLSVS